MYPKVLEELISCFKKYPTIGEKSAERLALATLDLSEEELNNFSNTLIKAKKVLKPCKICCNLTDKDICDICNDENRNKKAPIAVALRICFTIFLFLLNVKGK